MTIWLDSTVAWSSAMTRTLARLAHRKGHDVVVSAHVHLEQWRREHAKHGADFRPDIIWQFLQRKGIRIRVARMTLDQAAAERWADRLHARYAQKGEWLRAKLQCVRARLPVGTTLDAHRCPMTTDWLVALQVEDAPDAVVVTDDAGPPWAALRASSPPRAMTAEEAEAWLLSGQAPSAGGTATPR